MIELVKTLGIAGAAAVALIFLIRDVLGPLVKYVVEKKKRIADDAPRPKADDRVRVLEIDLAKLSTQVTNLETVLGGKNTELQTLVDERSIATDNKLDIVLAELKSLREDHDEQHRALADRMAEQYRILGERIKGVETDIKHLEKPRGR